MIKRYLPRKDENNVLGVEITVKGDTLVNVSVVKIGLRNKTERTIKESTLRIYKEPFNGDRVYTSKYGHGSINSDDIIRVIDCEECLKITLNPDGLFGYKGNTYIPHYFVYDNEI